jgi:hypothetical protein
MAGAMALALPGTAHAEMLYPQRFQHDLAYMQRYFAPYFQCDYNTHTCERGFRSRPSVTMDRVFELLSGDDQRTVLGHFSCGGDLIEYGKCFNYDTGETREMAVRQLGWRTISVVTNAGDCNAAALSNFGSLQCP